VLGRVDPQGSLLETRHMRRHLVTKGSFYERLADHGHEIVRDDDFAHLYHPSLGRPSIPPSVMVRAMLCATHDKTSDAETSRRTRVDADWKAAMGVDDDFLGIAPTTFSLMRSRMVVHEASATVFDRVLARAVKARIFRQPLTAIIDSSPVRGAGAVADTYALIRGFLAKATRAAGTRLSRQTRRQVAPLVAGKADIDWHDPDARTEHLGVLVAAARAVVDELGDVDDRAVAEPVGLLRQVVDQDVDDDEEGAPTIHRGVAADRIVSHADPEMRHGRKSASRRFDGHKMDVVVDEASELGLGVGVRAGNRPDGEAAAPLVEAVRATDGVEVAALVGDMAYSDPEVRIAVERAGATLVAKVPPARNRGRFPKTEFFVEVDRVTCPAGETTTYAQRARDHKGRPGVRFLFPDHVCAGCPVREQCVGGAAGRQVFVGMHEERMAAARAAEHDPAVRSLLRRRAKVERKIDHLQDLGMGKARYRGRTKTLLQLLLAASVANFKRLCVLGVFDVPLEATDAA
jgi:Transposase DDE domain/Transposase domain (DUF772)